MQKTLATVCGVMFLGLAATGARADDLTFLSTQMRPLEEATKARTLILKGAPMPVTYVPEEPPQLPIHLQADEQGAHTIGLVGALHGELAPLVGDAAADRPGECAGVATRHSGGHREACASGDRASDVCAVDAGDLHHGGEQEGAAVPAERREPEYADLRAT